MTFKSYFEHTEPIFQKLQILNIYKVNDYLQLISHNFSVNVANFVPRTSFRELRCEVQKFILKFTSRFVNKASDWLIFV
jgi:hypothetical protein